jgi:hypothetical protein
MSTFITFATTSSIDFGVLIYVIGSINPSIDDLSSYTILFPSLNSNGNSFANFGLLGGTFSSTNLNSSKVGCLTTLSVCDSISCRPSYVCCCCYKCCSKCYKCCEFEVVFVQFSYTFASKRKCSSPFGNLMSCSLFTS